MKANTLEELSLMSFNVGSSQLTGNFQMALLNIHRLLPHSKRRVLLTKCHMFRNPLGTRNNWTTPRTSSVFNTLAFSLFVVV